MAPSEPAVPPPSSHRPWLLRAPTADAAALLFCFPYSGCGASMFRRWPRTVGPAEACPIQLPGRENRIAEPHFGSLPALAEAACTGLAPFLDRPYAFFGHCAGALQAYEVTLRLADRGLPQPTRIFLSSQPPPDGTAAPSRFSVMSGPELHTELRRLLAALGARPTDEMVELYLSVYRPDLVAVSGYRQVRQVPTPITVISWADSGLPPDQLAGWASYGDASFVNLPGGHYDFLGAPPVLLNLFQQWARSAATGPTVATGGHNPP